MEGRACEPDRSRQGPTPHRSPPSCGVPADPGGLTRWRGFIPPRPEGRGTRWGEPASPIGPVRDRRPTAPHPPAGSRRTPADSPAGAGSSLHGPRGAGRDGGASLRARSGPVRDRRPTAPHPPAGSWRTPSDSPADAGSSTARGARGTPRRSAALRKRRGDGKDRFRFRPRPRGETAAWRPPLQMHPLSPPSPGRRTATTGGGPPRRRPTGRAACRRSSGSVSGRCGC